MRRLTAFLAAAALSSLIASVASGRAPSEDEAAWIRLTILASGEGEEVASHMRSHGISDASIGKLKTLMVKQRSAVEKMGFRRARELCAMDPKSLDAEGLAQVFEATEAEYSNLIRDTVRESERLMGEVDGIAFKSYVAHSDGTVALDSDIASLARTGKISPQQAVERACKAAKEK